MRSWPSLFPSGKYGLDFEREEPLTDLQYVVQRLCNKNTIFSSNFIVSICHGTVHRKGQARKKRRCLFPKRKTTI